MGKLRQQPVKYNYNSGIYKSNYKRVIIEHPLGNKYTNKYWSKSINTPKIIPSCIIERFPQFLAQWENKVSFYNKKKKEYLFAEFMGLVYAPNRPWFISDKVKKILELAQKVENREQI